MKLVQIAASRPVGMRCFEWAGANLPEGWRLTETFGPDDGCDVFISVMYDQLVSERFISGKEGRRCYNFHPGILPQYRGSGAFSWAIINGERECGVTLHELDVDIDHGPILDIERFTIFGQETAGDLFDRGIDLMEMMFKRWFAALLRGPDGNGYYHWGTGWSNKAEPQDESQARLYYRRDLQRARDLTRFVRAFTFEGKEPAFYVNSKGEKVEVRL